ncbi:MAG: hypothetical protein R2774_06755 [Saprospiraceae bacterium]
MSELDKIFKGKLEHHHVSVPSDMWDRIESNLYPKKDNKSRYLIGILLFSAIISGIFLYKYFTDSNSTIPSQITTAQNFAISEDSKQISSFNDINNNFHESPNIQVISENITLKNYPKKVKTKDSSLKKIEAHQQTLVESHDSNPFLTLLQRNLEQVEGASSIETPIKNEIATTEFSESFKQINTSPFSIANLEPVTFKLPVDRENLNLPLFKKVEVKPCPFGETDKFRRVDVYFSPEYAIRDLESHQDADDYLKMRKSTESANMSYSLGVRLGYSIGYRWNLMTGLNFTKINESFEYVDPESVSTRIIITKDYTIVNGIKVDSVVREEVVEIPGTEKMYINNSYKTLDLPIMARYIIAAPGRYSVSAIGGAMINLAFTTKGKIISPYTNSPDDISTGTSFAQNTYKTNIGATLVGGISFAYFLSPSLDILLEPTVKFQPTFLNYSDFPVRQRYTNVGLAAGFRFRF